MKYIKKFESELNLPAIGDYVCFELKNYSKEYFEVADFINKNIGVILNYITELNNSSDKVLVQYYNIPDDIQGYFFDDDSIILQTKSILFFGKNKADVIIQRTAYKYNL
jgi:hypothetical protein